MPRLAFREETQKLDRSRLHRIWKSVRRIDVIVEGTRRPRRQDSSLASNIR